MFRRWLAIPVLAAGLMGQQLPERQLQLRQQQQLEQRADEQRRQIVREQHEREEREHADALLIQRRRADEERQRSVQPPDPSSPAAPEAAAAPSINLNLKPPAIPRKYDFSPGLLARSLGFGLLAGACAFALGRMVWWRVH